MNDSNRKRIILNLVGPFIALPCLGEVVVNRNFGFVFTWLLLPATFAFSWLVAWAYFSTPSLVLIGLFISLFWASIAAYPIVALIPFIRDGYKKVRNHKEGQE